MSNEHWSLGTLVGLPLVVVAVLGFMVAAVLFRRFWKHNPNSYDAGIAHFFSWAGVGLSALLIVIAAIGFYPYGSDYHKWKPVDGKVQTVASRLLANGDAGSTQRFVVKFTDGRERACDDTRCALVKPGDHLALSCKRAFQWASTPGWDCNFVKRIAS